MEGEAEGEAEGRAASPGEKKAGRGEWGAIASSELLQLARDVASGLAYLHAHDVTHRDVKQANVMVQAVDHVGRAKLCDFGISSLKSSGPQSCALEREEVPI